MTRTHASATPEETFDTSTKPLRLDFECTRCKGHFSRQVEWALVSPEHAFEGGDWDGILLSDFVQCPSCRAIAEYRIAPHSVVSLVGNALLSDPERGWGGRVRIGESTLWDGTIARRPTQILERLRKLTRERPENAEAFRRLGNAYRRWGLTDEALVSWRRACKLDHSEVEAAYSLASFFLDQGDRTAEGFAYLQHAIRALPAAVRSAEVPYQIGQAVIDLLPRCVASTREPIGLGAGWRDRTVRGKRGLAMSAVDLRKVENFERLADLVWEGYLISLELTREASDEEPTMLQHLLSEDDAPEVAADRHDNVFEASPRIPARRAPTIGRNARCLCGSGKKYKRCCGGTQ